MSCFFACAGAATSFPGALFMAACVTVVAGRIGWIVTRELRLAVIAVAARLSAMLFAFIKAPICMATLPLNFTI